MNGSRVYTALLALLPMGSLQAMDTYVVSVPEASARVVHVRAELNIAAPELLMSPYGAEHLEYGWAEFVEDLKAFDTDGTPISIHRAAGGSFKVDAEEGTRLLLEYDVHIRHDLSHWPFGSDEAAYVQEEMMMATGNAIFITRLDLDSATVHFEMPEHYAVASAWRPIGEREYLVVGAEELVWTVLLMGQFEQHMIEAGDMNVLLAYGPELTSSGKEISSITVDAIAMYTRYFNGTPRTDQHASTYLMVMNVDTTFEGGGAAFTNSMSILFAEKPSTCSAISTHCWHHILVHELGHLWVGHSLLSDEADQWFREGFTDHLAFRLQHDIGLFTEEQWQEFLIQKEREAQQARSQSDVTLAEAGSNKAANHELIYSGGFQFAHRLDELIQEATQGKRDLLDLMASLYESHAGSKVPIDRTVLLNASKEICGCDPVYLFEEMLDRVP